MNLLIDIIARFELTIILIILIIVLGYNYHKINIKTNNCAYILCGLFSYQQLVIPELQNMPFVEYDVQQLRAFLDLYGLVEFRQLKLLGKSQDKSW